jgi:hypothetical protein
MVGPEVEGLFGKPCGRLESNFRFDIIRQWQASLAAAVNDFFDDGLNWALVVQTFPVFDHLTSLVNE